MAVFEVWYSGWNGEDNPKKHELSLPSNSDEDDLIAASEAAAEDFWTDLCSKDPDYYNGCDEYDPVCVRGPDGVVRKFTIGVDYDPVISAYRVG
jgi:hypothetical protein